jgi:hypothetical protein
MVNELPNPTRALAFQQFVSGGLCIGSGEWMMGLFSA